MISVGFEKPKYRTVTKLGTKSEDTIRLRNILGTLGRGGNE